MPSLVRPRGRRGRSQAGCSSAVCPRGAYEGRPRLARRFGSPWAAAFLAALLGLLRPSGELRATCRCGAGELELVFVLDATGSMGPVIGTVKAQAARIIEILESQLEGLRVGAVAFRTRLDQEMPVPVYLDLTSDRRKLADWLASVKALGGGEEAVEDGLECALRQMSWSPKSRKVVVIIGDEGPSAAGEKRLVALAGEARAKGIIVHTITPSDTAWLYYLNMLRNSDPEAARALFERYGSVENLRKSFRLPIFEETARAGGGRAVGTSDTRELVRWLLAFALASDDGDSPPELPAASSPARDASAQAARASGRIRIGWVRYGGEWRTPRAFDGLARHLAALVRIDLDEEPEELSLSDGALWRYPLLYVSGHGPFELAEPERKGLKLYLESGGTLWADACCGKTAFDKGLREELSRLFPGSPLERLGPSHPIFDIGHVIESVRYTVGHRRPEFKAGPPHVEVLRLGGREAVIYTPHGLGSGWKTYEYGMPCLVHDDDALGLSENIVLFALSR